MVTGLALRAWSSRSVAHRGADGLGVIHRYDDDAARDARITGTVTGMDELFTTLARAGGGLISTRAAMAAGVASATLTTATRRGRLVRVYRGWYVQPEPRRSPEEWHLLRVRAVLAQLAAGAVMTHHSALLSHRLPVQDADLDTVHVGRPVGTARGIAGGVVHRIPDGVEGSGEAVSPATAVIQHGLVAGPRAMLVSADAALRAEHHRQEGDGEHDLDTALGLPAIGTATELQLRAAARAYGRCSGIGPVVAALELADGRAESPGESLLRYDLRMLGYDVEPQHRVMAGNREYRTDLRIVATPVVIEFDGLVKYADPDERRRQEERHRVLERLGYIVVRFVWSELGHLALIRNRIEVALADAAQSGPRARRLLWAS